MKKTIATSLALSAILMSSSALAGESKVLRIATWLPSQHQQNSIVFPKWAENG